MATNTIIESKPKRRWGIFAISVVMALVHFIAAADEPGPASFYAAFWIYASYLSIKGDIKTLASYIKIILILNAVGILFVAVLDQEYILRFWGVEKIPFISVALVYLAAEFVLYLYLKNELDNGAQNESAAAYIQKSNTNPQPAPTTQKVNVAIAAINPPSAKIIDTTAIQNSPRLFELARSSPMEDESLNFYEQALNEIDTNEKHKGTWAKAFAETESEDQARKYYIKMRVQNLNSEKRTAEAKAEEEHRAKAEEERKLKAAEAKAEEQRKLKEAEAKAEEQRKLKEAEAKAEEQRKLKEAVQAKEKAHKAVYRNDFSSMKWELGTKGHFLTTLFLGGYQIRTNSGQETKLKNWSELQEYYDKHA